MGKLWINQGIFYMVSPQGRIFTMLQVVRKAALKVRCHRAELLSPKLKEIEAN